MNKLKEIMKAVGRYTAGYVANHWKEFLTGLLGGLAASAATGCSGLSQRDHEVSTSVWAVGIPGVAIIKQSAISPDNRGEKDNTAIQSNPVSVKPSFK